MDRGAESSSSAAKRAKKDKEDPLVRRRTELIREIANARAAMKEQGNNALREATESLMQDLRSVCKDIEAENRNELLKKLPKELWEKIVGEHVQQNDRVALAMTCRFFRDTAKILSRKLETILNRYHLLELQDSGKRASHSLGWFQWVCDTFKILPGFFPRGWGRSKRVGRAVYEGELLNYAAFQGSVEILRWLVEEKEWKLNWATGERAGMSGSVEILECLSGKGYKFDAMTCYGVAHGGCLEALKFLRGLDPPCPWDWRTSDYAAERGHLDVLKWARSQDPPCTWIRVECISEAMRHGHLHIVDWIDQQEYGSDEEEYVDFYM